jgi:hypothetical protein
VGTASLRAARRIIAAFLISACSVSIAGAQSIVDAGRAEFTPSADHNAVDGTGNALVDRYAMDIFLAGGATPVESVDLGKPQPETDGYIRVNFLPLLTVPLTPGVSYEAIVSAVGPGGSAASNRSNTFGLSVPCGFSISPSGQSFAATGGATSFDVATDATCQWTAVSQAAWLTVTAGASGTGPGSVSVDVAANTDTISRTGTVLAAGWNFTVLQSASASVCAFTVSPTSVTVPAAGGTASIAVSTTDGCAWTATSPVLWAVVSSGASGSGPGTVTLTIARNTNFAIRSATLTIAGSTVTLTQKARHRRK